MIDVRQQMEFQRANGGRPRVHCNGFIQVDVNERDRVHFWGIPFVPRQSVPTPIHDHAFAFTSFVAAGRIINIRYHVGKGMTHSVYEPTKRPCSSGAALAPTGDTVKLTVTDADVIGAGTGYRMLKGQTHQTIGDSPAVTVIRKTGKTHDQGGPAPRVFVPLGLIPDNTFDRYALPADTLWDMVFGALDELKL